MQKGYNMMQKIVCYETLASKHSKRLAQSLDILHNGVIYKKECTKEKTDFILLSYWPMKIEFD